MPTVIPASVRSPVETAVLLAVKHKASDIHIKSNRSTKIRVRCNLMQTDIMVSVEEIWDFCAKYMPREAEKIAQFKEYGIYAIDSTVTVCNRRLRLHLYRSNNGVCCTLRLLAGSIPELDTLNLPPSLISFTEKKSGLVLITGATGSGKTTTIASIVNEINKTRDAFILTVEDPVEYIYTEQKATIEQKEVGHDTASFSNATIEALREDPDVIVVGEMRDLETIRNAITLAETGHLVFATLHTKSVVDTIDRIVDSFPSEQQNQIRLQLSSILHGVVHQQMLTYNNNVTVLCEVMIVDNVLASMIRSHGQSANSFRDYIRGRPEIGGVHLVDNAYWHIINHRLDFDAVKNILSEDDMKLLMTRFTMKRGSGNERVIIPIDQKNGGK